MADKVKLEQISSQSFEHPADLFPSISFLFPDEHGNLVGPSRAFDLPDERYEQETIRVDELVAAIWCGPIPEPPRYVVPQGSPPPEAKP